MQTSVHPVLRDIVLIGGGHSHVGVIKNFGMNPQPGVRLTVICTDTHTPYSGMLPGYIAGHYSYDEVHIDLAKLCVFAGARLYRDEVIGIDRVNGKVLCRHRPPVLYDALSINIGSTPQLVRVEGAAAHTVPVKPIRQFNQRWLALLERVRQHPGRTTLAVVGGGAGGVELALAMQYRLRHELHARGRNPDDVVFHLFTDSATVLPTHSAGVRRRFAQVLAQRGVVLHLGAEVVQVTGGEHNAQAQGQGQAVNRLQTSQGESLDAHEIMWVTQAGGAAWLQSTGLALDGNGFIQVNDCLQTVTDPRIFAAGDIAAMVGRPLEKAGVFAVRQGRPLAENLRRSVLDQTLRPYRPQRHWLALISTGDKHAVASRGPFGLGGLGRVGAWIWRWKDNIDQSFMRRFGVFPTMNPAMDVIPSKAKSAALPMTSDESQQAISAIAMRCGGCGAKVGATVLSRALGQLQPVQRDDVLIGLHSPDDAAVLRVPPGMAVVQSVDFFRAFIDDPYLFGKVAANHALGDIFAMGGEAQSATAIVTVPPGIDAKVEDLLFQMMSGAVEVLNAAHCALVGGHTGEGRELALGFAINGLIDESMVTVLRKGGMQPGDVLLLTKPLGTGTLFAAHAQGRAKGRWIDAALTSMVQSSRSAAQVLRRFGATACTDVTGFGLLGHLVEMTKPSGVDAELDLSALPLLDGALETVAMGIVSSLQPANVRLRRVLRNPAEFVEDPRYPLLFDPQTAGGLLASVSEDRAEACVAALRDAGYGQTAVIGRVRAVGTGLEPITLHAALEVGSNQKVS